MSMHRCFSGAVKFSTLTSARIFIASFISIIDYYTNGYYRSRRIKQNLFHQLQIPGPQPNLVFGNLHSIAGKVRTSHPLQDAYQDIIILYDNTVLNIIQ